MLGCCRRLSGWAEPLPAAASPARPGCKLLPPGALLQTHKIDGWHTATHLQAEAVRLARQASNKGFFS